MSWKWSEWLDIFCFYPLSLLVLCVTLNGGQYLFVRLSKLYASSHHLTTITVPDNSNWDIKIESFMFPKQWPIICMLFQTQVFIRIHKIPFWYRVPCWFITFYKNTVVRVLSEHYPGIYYHFPVQVIRGWSWRLVCSVTSAGCDTVLYKN